MNTAVTNGQEISKSVVSNMNEFVEVNNKMLENHENLDEIFSDIDAEFVKKTSILNPKDQVFLWTAVALQTARWVLLPSFKVDDISLDYSDRNEAGTEAKKGLKNMLYSSQEI